MTKIIIVTTYYMEMNDSNTGRDRREKLGILILYYKVSTLSVKWYRIIESKLRLPVNLRKLKLYQASFPTTML